MLNGLSVDVEVWFQVGAFETVIDRGDWPRLETRVERNTDAVLALYNRATTVRLHGESILPAGTELNGDLGVLDGPLVLAGRVLGNVVVINGDLRFEPGAEVGGDVIVVGGIAYGLAHARVHGTTTVYREPLRYRRDGDLLARLLRG